MADTTIKPRRIYLDKDMMNAFETLCRALATLVQAEIITHRQALAIIAEYGMEPRDHE
mgnify:CR=1 FL=1